MTGFLVAAVCVLGVVTLLDLFLSLAIIKRLRRPAGHHGPQYVVETLPAGTPMPRLELDTVDGTTVDFAESGPNRRTLIAFLAAHCGPCHEQLPRLREIVADLNAHGDRAIVVVLTFSGRAPDFSTAFDGLAPVVLQGDEERVSRPFEVSGYPTYVMFESGVRTHAAATVDDLVAVKA